MKWTATIDTLTQPQERLIGGKGLALATLRKKGFTVPDTGVVTTRAYSEYVAKTALKERIALELNRKDFEDMRWEEIWDASLRIRNFFITTPLPKKLDNALKEFVASHFSNEHVVVRSSAPGEDSGETSFAGIHDSFVDITGAETILEHIRLVWASLWSDKSLLYRRELNLDPHKSSMAVLIQRIIRGEASGVAFSASPMEESQGVVESVYGLNQDLVDGTVEPYRWIFDRKRKLIISAVSPGEREEPSDEATIPDDSHEESQIPPPLSSDKALQVFSLALSLEDAFGTPQDVEWTFEGAQLWVLQSRPITTSATEDSDDNRSWYLSLSRSVQNLVELMKKIEGELIPAMIEEAAEMAAINLEKLSHTDLAQEITQRSSRYEYWKGVYWTDFIPFAHGMRVFGEFYNKTVRPVDPFEFVTLLSPDKMESLERNGLLEEMASMVREDKTLEAKLAAGEAPGNDHVFNNIMATFQARFGHQFSAMTAGSPYDNQSKMVISMVLKMALRPRPVTSSAVADRQDLEKCFLDHFAEEDRRQAVAMLKLARASYRLRDDDNIHLGRIEGALMAAIREGRRRIDDGYGQHDDYSDSALISVLEKHDVSGKEAVLQTDTKPKDFTYKARQIVGQPAGPGIAKGSARVVHDKADLLACAEGDILVCDAIDPDMTFIIPLVGAIVERRGGMLIHGAIIAREYGIPCVTGISRATSRIRTGDTVTVDGFLGIVTIS